MLLYAEVKTAVVDGHYNTPPWHLHRSFSRASLAVGVRRASPAHPLVRPVEQLNRVYHFGAQPRTLNPPAEL
jgi:hypothetical protein